MPRPKGVSCPLPALNVERPGNSLADRINEAMRQASNTHGKPVTQSDLARAVNLDQSSINNLCRGASVAMKAETALCMAHALDVNVKWLVTGAGPMRGTYAPKHGEETKPPRTTPRRTTPRRRIHDHVDEIHRRVVAITASVPAKRRAQMFGTLRAVLRSFEP